MNSTLFHRYVSIKKKNSTMSMLRVGEEIYSDNHMIQHHVVDFYKNLFNGHSTVCSGDFSIIPEVIPYLVLEEDNLVLTREPTAEEVREATFSMNEHSVPSPDGFNGTFYRSCWETIGENVVEAIKKIFTTGEILRNINSNFMVLIPKFEGADSLDKFRPIVLGNFFFKIITKIIADRLNSIASSIVSHHQFGFIRGHRIYDCIAIASEAINCLDSSNGRNMAIQIDIKKAFDTLNWDFILQVLKGFGFCDKFCNWVSNIFNYARISVLINGVLAGFFKCSRGVRQRDPLSPLLYDIAKEFLSRYLSALCNFGVLQAETLLPLLTCYMQTMFYFLVKPR